MDTFFMVLVFSIVISGILSAFFVIKEKLLFKKGHTPYSRICKKCNSHQIMYSSNIEGEENIHWWQEVYPIGNNEKCKCHSYAEYHN